MATVAEMITDLAAVEAEIQTLYTAPDFEDQAGSSGRVKVTHSTRLAFLERRSRELRIRIAMAGGTLTSEPTLAGIDALRGTDNGDW